MADMAARWARATLLLLGPTPGELCARYLGLYELQSSADLQSVATGRALVNGRPVYAQQGKKGVLDARLWYAHHSWFVGPPASVGDASGSLHAKAATPLASDLEHPRVRSPPLSLLPRPLCSRLAPCTLHTAAPASMLPRITETYRFMRAHL